MKSSRSETALPPDLADALAQARGRLRGLGSPLLYFATIGSTNDVAAVLAANGGREGAVVIADAQTAGRGRRGRTWFSPPASGLYMSVVLAPARARIDPDRATALLTLAAGVAIAEAIETVTGLSPDLKWPNDLYVGRRKLAGILAEGIAVSGTPEAESLRSRPRSSEAVPASDSLEPLRADAPSNRGGGGAPPRVEQAGAPRPRPVLDTREHHSASASTSGGGAPREVMKVVLGYGINVGPMVCPPELADRATSLESELGRPIDRAAVCVETLAALAARYDDLLEGRFDAILDAWRRRAPSHRGARVSWETASGTQLGLTDGVDERGALLVRVGERTERIVAGEVSWL